MKLWILRATENQDEDNPFGDWMDVVRGLVVRAETAADARRLASKKRGFERPEAWLNARYTSCVELTYDGQVTSVDECLTQGGWV